MEIVSIEKKTFEEMKERFGSFSQHVRELCARYRPPEKMNWMDGADVCEKLGISKRTLQTYRDRGLLPYSQINHKIYYRTEDVEAFMDWLKLSGRRLKDAILKVVRQPGRDGGLRGAVTVLNELKARGMEVTDENFMSIAKQYGRMG